MHSSSDPFLHFSQYDWRQEDFQLRFEIIYRKSFLLHQHESCSIQINSFGGRGNPFQIWHRWESQVYLGVGFWFFNLFFLQWRRWTVRCSLLSSSSFCSLLWWPGWDEAFSSAFSTSPEPRRSWEMIFVNLVERSYYLVCTRYKN